MSEAFQDKHCDEADGPLNIRLHWKIVHNPEEEPAYGLHWVRASCECDLILSTHAGNKESLLERELAEEAHHFAFGEKARRLIKSGILQSIDCECCGKRELKYPYVIQGHVVGNECRLHPKEFPCKSKVSIKPIREVEP